MLIIWDKIFGTFTEEKEQPVYGLTKPLNSHSFLWQHFHYHLELMLAIKKTTGLGAKVKILFGRPDSVDPNLRAVLERFFLSKNPGLDPTIAHRRYITIQTAITLTGLFALIYFFDQLPATECWFASLFILLSVINTGAILEQKSWIFQLEFARFWVLLFYIWVQYPDIFTSVCKILLAIVLIYYFRPIEKRYMRLLFR